MAENTEVPLTEADLQTFIEKLEKWGDGLSDAEKGMLNLLLARAEAGDSEVSGFGFQMPGDMTRPGPGLRANEMLGPMVQGGSLFFNTRGWDVWERG